jgi:type IV secretory pathway VirB10-like protein
VIEFQGEFVMFSSRVTIAALAVACVAAAGVGGYVASRQNAIPAPAAAAGAASDVSAASPSQPVQETEAVVAPERTGADAKAQSTPGTPNPARRAEPSRTAVTPASKAASTNARNNPPALERPWPSTSQPASTSTPPAVPPGPTDSASSAPIDSRPAFESPRAPDPPQKVFDELVVSANSVIGLETENRISSETARIEDRVEAKVTRDVKVGDTIAIPAGSRAIGSVIQVDRGGKFKERARLGIRFTTIVLADGTRLPMSTETIYRESDGPANSSAAKIGGGAVGGAILGAILGGAKGAAIGASAGAGGGVAAVEAGDRREILLPAGSPMTVRLLTPLTVTVEQH